MSEKTVHVFFRVANFIHCEYSKKYPLKPIDKLILYNIASHGGKNSKGLFPMQQTIAKELGVSIRYIRERTKYMQSLGLLNISKMGRRYCYGFPFLADDQFLYAESQFRYGQQTHLDLSTIAEPQFPYSPVDNTQQGNHSSSVQGNHSSAHRGTTVPTKNKGSNTNKRTRESAPLSPVDFEINLKSKERIEELELTEDEANEMIDKFVIHYSEGKGRDKTSDDWNRVLIRWIDREVSYMEEREVRKKLREPEEKPWYHKETEHMQRGNGMAALGKILENLRPNGQGGSTNGLGAKGKGKD